MSSIERKVKVPNSAERFPIFSRPQQVGTYGVSDSYEYSNNPSRKYFAPSAWKPSALSEPLDLNHGEVVEDKLDSGMKHFCRWIKENSYRLSGVDFVCFRGLLNKAMSSPYDSDPFGFFLVKVKGVIYLLEDKSLNMIPNDFMRKTMRWGYKFEDYLIENGKPSLRYDPNVELDAVFSAKLDGMSILYGAEMDAQIQTDDPNSPSKDFVEFKTSKIMSHRGHYKSFVRWKTRKWWGQCFLVGIPLVVCGLRDDEGFVHEIRHYNTHDLPKMEGVTWRPNVCFGFLANVLRKIKTEFVHEENVVYKIFLEGCSSSEMTVSHKKTDMNVSEILPPWYTDLFRN